MLISSIRSKIAAAAFLFLARATYGEPVLTLDQYEGLRNDWYHAQRGQIVGHGGSRRAQYGQRDLWSSQGDQRRIGNSLSDLYRTEFPDRSYRYKTPDICDPSVKQVSGYMDVESDKHLFFWFFESRNKPKEDPLILWLNGGPGCSSMVGLFTELGPCFVNIDGDGTILNEHSWTNNASIIFLDQPVNTGYSYGNDGVFDSVAAAEDVYTFLQMFFKDFPQYSTLDFHLAGESYAGHYIPAIGGEIHRNNRRNQLSFSSSGAASTPLAPINLKSLMIGNGMTDPLVQYKYYGKMACDNSYGPVLNQTTCDQMDVAYSACAALIEQCYSSQKQSACEPALDKCNIDMIGPYVETGRNMYDVRKDCRDPDYCYEIDKSMLRYLNRPDVMMAIGAHVATYDRCNNTLGEQFNARDGVRPYMDELPPLLEAGIRILIYAGDADYICNWMGNKAWMLELPWSGQDEFSAANDTNWFSTTANEQGGELRRTEDGRFAFLRIFDAGHMVPMDRGGYALDMMNQWLHGELA